MRQIKLANDNFKESFCFDILYLEIIFNTFYLFHIFYNTYYIR